MTVRCDIPTPERTAVHQGGGSTPVWGALPELLGGVGEGAPVGTAGGEGGDTYIYGWGGKEGGTCRYVQLGVSGAGDGAGGRHFLVSLYSTSQTGGPSLNRK